MRFIVVFITASSKKEAQAIVSALVKKKLAACGNIIGSVDSMFIWKGKTEKAKEALIILKARAGLFKRIVREVERLHSYDVPEIIAVPIIAGSKKYLEWLDVNV
ncbi:MAG: divalent-cation tolerance protein CutA [Candidatus Omnitrophica bacterium]|nr:divalent-cation tolerance protein CutA [Candidatus Omnitrophota bacterium]